ncbi:MAG: hypothetical protein PHF86_07280 [Candidatus Nanoarchaeia archaeon]|nr:hypothetical protein [Candidatus Nanoarchaeia archaeon]
MGLLKQKVIFDAGVSNPKNDYEINDQTGRLTSAPKSPYAITETINIAFTYNYGVLGPNSKNLNIADGERRPGTAG